MQHLAGGVVEQREDRLGDVRLDLETQVVPPDLVEVEEAQEAHQEEQERHDRREDLEGDRARVG